MNEVVTVDSSGSEDSIVEIKVPRKRTPPLIYIEDEEIILNIRQNHRGFILAKDFINNDRELSEMTKRARSSQIINNPSHWTPDMVKFYNDDWGDEEQFIVEKLQREMDKTPSLWEISRKDKLQNLSKFRSHVKCRICRERGHSVSYCPNQSYKPKCHMCGTPGHVEYSCPNAKCLNCGSLSENYITCCINCKKQAFELCSRCRIIGHNFINCPDHWRLFHLTTETTTVKIPEKNVNKSAKDMWCCNCGKKGHYQTHCMVKKDCGAFKDSLPFVISYQKAFRDNWFRNKQNDVFKKKHKRYHKNQDKAETALKVNPMNKAINKEKIQSKRKFKRLKKQLEN